MGDLIGMMVDLMKQMVDVMGQVFEVMKLMVDLMEWVFGVIGQMFEVMVWVVGQVGVCEFGDVRLIKRFVVVVVVVVQKQDGLIIVCVSNDVEVKVVYCMLNNFKVIVEVICKLYISCVCEMFVILGEYIFIEDMIFLNYSQCFVL